MDRMPNKTVLVQIGELRGMSDIAGRHLISMDESWVTSRGIDILASESRVRRFGSGRLVVNRRQI